MTPCKLWYFLNKLYNGANVVENFLMNMLSNLQRPTNACSCFISFREGTSMIARTFSGLGCSPSISKTYLLALPTAVTKERWHRTPVADCQNTQQRHCHATTNTTHTKCATYIAPYAPVDGVQTECRHKMSNRQNVEQTKCRQTKCRADKMSTIFFLFL